jgi:hypothetical protein
MFIGLFDGGACKQTIVFARLLWIKCFVGQALS